MLGPNTFHIHVKTKPAQWALCLARTQAAAVTCGEVSDCPWLGLPRAYSTELHRANTAASVELNTQRLSLRQQQRDWYVAYLADSREGTTEIPGETPGMR